MTANDFNPKDCPIGIANEKNIENLGVRVDMAIERLTERVTEMKKDIAVLSENMDKKFESVDKRFDSMEEKFTQKLEKMSKSVPDVVNRELQNKKGNIALKILGWIFGSLGAAVTITVVTRYVCNFLGL